MWLGCGGDNSCCKDGNYDCCTIPILKYFLKGGGDGASGGGGLVAGMVVVVLFMVVVQGLWRWW